MSNHKNENDMKHFVLRNLMNREISISVTRLTITIKLLNKKGDYNSFFGKMVIIQIFFSNISKI